MMLSPATSTPSLGSKSISRHPWRHREDDPKRVECADEHVWFKSKLSRRVKVVHSETTRPLNYQLGLCYSSPAIPTVRENLRITSFIAAKVLGCECPLE